jgi:ABC-type lipoprotein release transport system permease subunit
MTGISFALRGLWFFRTSYLGVLAGAALGAMVLLGALMAGDSVKATLRHVAEARLGKVDSVLSGGDRFFRAALADDMARDSLEAAPVLWAKATVSVARSGRTLGKVQVLGVDRRFWRFAPGAEGFAPPQDRGFFVNESLARSLDLTPGESLVLRFEKPSVIARDVPLAGKAADPVTLRGDLEQICDDTQFGRFNLETTQEPQATVFVPIERLQKALELAGKANLMLLGKDPAPGDGAGLERVTRHCTLEDYGLTVEDIPLAKAVEIRSARIFFDRKVASAIRKQFPAAQPVITYLANSISSNGKTTPYSMVTAVGPEAAPFLPDMSGGVVLNDWEAEDIGAKAGDEVRIDYYALDEGQRLVERQARLPVRGVVSLTGLAADPRWMPDFPGLSAAEHAADWDPGVPIDLKRIRDKDEAYWEARRGTPKLFMPLETGRNLFGNRWGEFTALRVPTVAASRAEVEAGLLAAMSPPVAGLMMRDVRSQGMAAAESPVDFAGLLLGMSLFLIAAAVGLTAMLFRFHIEQRNRESGLMTALGIPASNLLRWRMLEGLGVVLAGSAMGALLAAGYTQWLLERLETLRNTADTARLFRFHAEPVTLLAGVAGFVVVMMGVIWQVTRQQSRRSASLRLEAGTEEVLRSSVGPVPWWAAGFALTGGAALTGTRLLGIQGAFFLAGCAFLLAGLAAFRWALRRKMAAVTTGELTARRMAALNCGRRATRSLVVVGTLASGVFLVLSVAAFRKFSGDEWRERHSGAGGFAFWVETTHAVGRDNASSSKPDDLLELGAARQHFGQVLPVRSGPGDDASCFNLNRIARPRLLATDTRILARLDAFPIKQVMAVCAKNWNCLREGDALRAFVDETTLLWVLKRKLGDRMIYQDEWGRDFPVEIAGTLDATVFQGGMVVDDARFLEHYPSADGPRIFLMESTADPGAGKTLLKQSLADQGAVVTSTRERLAAFHSVENTYISIFQVLGGLGVILGSAGMGVATARNLLDRRHEFTILHAVGVPGTKLRRIVLLETSLCIRWGLGIGSLAACISILPVLSAAGNGRSLAGIAMLLLLIAGNAGLCSWIGWRLGIRPALMSPREPG